MKKLVRSMFAIVLAVSMAVSAGALAYAAGGEPDIAPCTDGRYFWKIESKTYKGYKYNDWKNITSFVVTKKNAPMDVTFSVGRSYENRVTGTIKVTNSQLEQEMGYDLDKTNSVTITATKKDAPAGTYYLQARSVYKYWQVKQQRYYTIDGVTTKAGNPVYCYPQKFDHIQAQVK